MSFLAPVMVNTPPRYANFGQIMLFKQIDGSGEYAAVYENEDGFDFLFAIYPLTRKDGDEVIIRGFEVSDNEVAVVAGNLGQALTSYLEATEGEYDAGTFDALMDCRGNIADFTRMFFGL